MSDSVWPHRRQPTRLPCPWDSPGKNTGVDCHFLLQCMKVKSESEVTQSCPTLCHPTDCSLPGSSILGIFQARVLDWGAIAFSDLSWELSNFIWFVNWISCNFFRKCSLALKMELASTYRSQFNKQLKFTKKKRKNLEAEEVFLTLEGTPMTDLVG